jgi:16S rRNA (uracil1498-N3)-methyltransferase
MLRLHVDEPLSSGLMLDLPPGAARHAQVRRVQPGDALVLFDGRGGEWQARVQAMGR